MCDLHPWALSCICILSHTERTTSIIWLTVNWFSICQLASPIVQLVAVYAAMVSPPSGLSSMDSHTCQHHDPECMTLLGVCVYLCTCMDQSEMQHVWLRHYSLQRTPIMLVPFKMRCPDYRGFREMSQSVNMHSIACWKPKPTSSVFNVCSRD